MTTRLIEEIEVLTAEQCAKARTAVHELSDIWDEDRYRLGAGISYYKPQALYYATSKCMNPILSRHFGWLYELLLETFAKALSYPVKFRDDLALPGFNIYCGTFDFSKIVYNIHVDLQYNELNWDPPGSTDFTKPLSFTLPIAAPSKGSGLNIWDVTRSDVADAGPEALAQMEDLKNYHPYKPGIASIHDGLHYHQMSIAPGNGEGDERITMQGHGLRQNGALILYG